LVELAEFPDMNPGPVFRLDLEGIVLRANVAARKVFQTDELLAASWLELCPGMTPERWSEVLSTTEPVNHEAEVGDCCLVFTHAHRPGSDHVFVFGADITARRQAEQALQQQKQELEELARFPEMNPGPVCRLDRGGNIVLANAAARRLFDDEALVGQCWLDVCPKMTAGRWEGILASERHVSHEVEVRDRYVMLTHTPGADEQELFVYGTDLTEQRTAERALHQSERMATLGTLAAGVAHELNNPAAAAQRAAQQLTETFARLQQVQLRLEQASLLPEERSALSELDAHVRERAACACELSPLARSDLEARFEEWLEAHGTDEPWDVAPALVSMGYELDSLDELATAFRAEHVPAVVTWLSFLYPVYSLLEEIRHASGRLSEIVGALKAYSYVGQAPVQSIDVNEGLRNTLIILRSKLKISIEVQQELAADLPRIQAFGGDLNQVWTNLIDNSVSAMDGRGRITLRSRRDGGHIAIEIEDSGPGIPAAIQTRIFDPFFTTKGPGEGTGLGLHTSYSIVVEKHGGTIDVSSRPGCTRFTVKLPIDGRSPADGSVDAPVMGA
jgi:signal transduction histidine kinase